MSNAQKFLEVAMQNKEIAKKLNDLDKAKMEAVQNVAKEYGYDFTIGELNETLTTISAAAAEEPVGRCYTFFQDCYAVLS